MIIPTKQFTLFINNYISLNLSNFLHLFSSNMAKIKMIVVLCNIMTEQNGD